MRTQDAGPQVFAKQNMKMQMKVIITGSAKVDFVTVPVMATMN